ncbi:diguanylate cyclase [Aquipseudomonas campi]|uniref:Diguanylate cyclase n=1 Tax=Aquipseudomonas campi TaxID=2731681 RepID=A0A6M8FBM7_9GAMM|nr:diguanylate cyclase [Pseudomonas campi]QKE63593.1 diguanylate cyclase [Pseudomonas campi]
MSEADPESGLTLGLVQALHGLDGERWFRQMADGLPLIVWTARADGAVDYFNWRWWDFIGARPGIPDERGWQDVLHPDDLPPTLARWQQALATGESYAMEYRFRRAADQTYRWHLGRAEPLRQADGQILKWLGTCTDIDDQKRAAESLAGVQQRLQEQVLERTMLIERVNTHLLAEVQKGEYLLRQLQSHTDNLARIIATQTRLAEAELDLDLFLNLVVQQMQELTPASGAAVELVEGEEMVYRAASGSVAPFVGVRLAIGSSLSGLCVRSAAVLMSADTEQDPRVDLAACRKIGVASMVVAPLLLAGKAVGVLKIMASQANAFSATDVQTLQLMAGLLGSELGHQVDFENNQRLLAERTEEVAKRMASEAVLRANVERTQRIIESSHEAFVCVNEQSEITDWNSEASRIFGWERGEVIGRPLTSVIIPERLGNAHHEGMARFIRTGQGPVINRRVELPALRKDGSELIVEITISTSGSGAEREFSAFMRDVTERKRTEQEVLLNQQLLRSVTDAIPAVVAFIDMREVLRYCNKPFLQTFGKIEAQCLGHSLLELLGADEYAFIQPHVAQALAGQQTSFERALKVQGNERYLEVRYVPERDIGGEVRGFYLILWDITERWALEQQFRLRALRDSLTGLLNRAAIMETLERAIAEHGPGSCDLALLYLDVDHFKEINDNLGHAVGDEVLKIFAARLQRSVRTSDVVARLGGDEFVILLQHLSSAELACEVAAKVIEAMVEPLQIRQHSLAVSTSIGVAMLDAQTPCPETLLEKADQALYQAKQAGRNRFSLSS